MSDNNLAQEKFEEGMADLHAKMGHTDEAAEDIRMVTQLSEVNIESFANENNVWRSQQLRLETMYNDDPAMER